MTAANVGLASQDAVAWQNTIYHANGLLLARYCGVIAEKHAGRWVPSRSWPDFRCTLTCLGGRSCSFDVKHTQERVYRHDPRRAHQLVHLWEEHAAGGVAFLLVERVQDEWYLIWPRASWEHGHSGGVDLRAEAVPVPLAGSNRLPDWLSVVIQEADHD